MVTDLISASPKFYLYWKTVDGSNDYFSSKVAVINYKHSVSDRELKAILELQAENLARVISPEEAAREGFVTLKHDFEILTKMNSPYPHSIAMDNDKIAGYALVSELHHFDHFPEMKPALDIMNNVIYQGKKLSERKYFFMGQTCVAKAYRGQGVLAGMYEHQRQHLAPIFEYNVTIISSKNVRSMRAHEKIGFQVIKSVPLPEGYNWEIVLWDWRDSG